MTKSFTHQALRAFSLCALIAAAPISAHAAVTVPIPQTSLGSPLALTIPTNFLQADAVLPFSEDALNAFSLVGITIKPLGNASMVPNMQNVFNLPVTSISLELIKVAGGSASGSALELNRLDEDTGKATRLTLANFAIDFNAKKIFADSTPLGKATMKKVSIFEFKEQTQLALKYKFPLSISLKQILDKLFLTSEAKKLIKEELELPEIADTVLEITDFGTINIDVGVKLRSRPVSTRPYVVAP